MKNHNKVNQYITFSLFVLIAIFTVVKANQASALVPLQQIKLDPDKLKLASCTLKKTNIEKRLENFDSKKAKHVEIYTKLKDRLSEKLTSWKEAGYDTDKLESDLKELGTKINKFNTDFKAYIDKLTSTKDLACDTGTNYSASLKEAKNLLKTVRTDVVDIRTYYQKTIRPDIVALKQQKISTEGN